VAAAGDEAAEQRLLRRLQVDVERLGVVLLGVRVRGANAGSSELAPTVNSMISASVTSYSPNERSSPTVISS
jgi:hypothetical protein